MLSLADAMHTDDAHPPFWPSFASSEKSIMVERILGDGESFDYSVLSLMGSNAPTAAVILHIRKRPIGHLAGR